MRNQKGQIVLILVLVMTVALAIGISVVQRSLSDISTATSVEQSSRAFSAAEAGIEKALRLQEENVSVNFSENQSSATVTGGGTLLPPVNTLGRQLPLEYPPLAKEETAHVWLADPNANLPTCTPSNICYKRDTLDIYWGNSTTDPAALELNLVYWTGTQYSSRKWFLDASATRVSTNHFDLASDCAGHQPLGFTTRYQCKVTLGDFSINATRNGPLQPNLMLIRARLLYNDTSQPFAAQARDTCGNDCSIPPQARRIVSIGISGKTQRKIELFQIDKVVPSYFDYAIFSAGDINK